MQNIYLYKLSAPNPNLSGFIVSKTNGSIANYTLVTSIQQMEFALGAIGDYKTGRDCIKTRVEELTWAGLTTEEQRIAARNNIGTGAQILAAIPSDLERDGNSYNYLKTMLSSVRPRRAALLEAACWSRMKHLLVDVGGGNMVTAPELIYSLITIDTVAAQGEMVGNLLALFTIAGVQGFIAGDKSLGIYDFIQETVGTRFEGMGLRSHPLLVNLVPDGFVGMNDFADALFDLLDLGFSDLLF